MIKALNLLEGPSTDWLECTECNTYVDTYQPMPHQFAVHMDEHRVIGNFGAYGTGKTKTSGKEIEKHIFLTPGANILVGANVSSQYEQTIQRDFEKSFPLAFVKSRSIQKGYIDFVNNARLMFRPFDDPDKLRSNSYSLAVMLEASECKAEAFHQLKTRVRNLEATVLEKDEEGNIVYDELGRPIILFDWRKMICESNPDSGWIRSDVLMVSSKITRHGAVNDNYQQEDIKKDKHISTHVASTDVNKFLPKDYIEVNTKNKPDWWVRKFIYSSFSFSEGLVYPKAMDAVVEPIKLDPRWLRIVAHDYGLADSATFVFGAIDKDNGLLYIYKEVRTNNRSIDELARMFKDAAADIPVGGWYTVPIIDPKNNKRDYNKKDLITHYSEYGISFQPGHIQLDSRIFRLNTYFETGRIRIFNTCNHLVNELRDYKFPDQKLSDTKRSDKPVDKNNHSINPVEWIVMELPADPRKLELDMYNAQGVRMTTLDEEIRRDGWQLADEQDSYAEQEHYGVDFHRYR